MNLYFFNYSHDLALANGDAHYLSPESVRMMERDLGALAVWSSGPGDAILVDEDRVALCQAYYESLHRSERLFVSLSSLPVPSSFQCWGINPSVLCALERAGLSTVGAVPAEVVRALSSRRWACALLEHLRSDLPEVRLCGASRFCETKEEIQRAMTLFPHAVFKAPLSGSGRGLRFSSTGYVQPLSGWCRRLLQKQGGVVVEPVLDKVLDFACEFFCLPGEVRFMGLSCFRVSERFTYEGNRVAAQDVLRQEIFSAYDEQAFRQVMTGIQSFLLTSFCDRYTGPLGVDMMMCRDDDGGVSLHPCVEINLRRTMGMVALHLAGLLTPGTEAQFRILYYRDAGKCRQEMDGLPRPVFDACNRLQSGVLQLTPVAEDTHYVACLQSEGDPFSY